MRSRLTEGSPSPPSITPPPNVTLAIPGSNSISNCAVVLATLSNGTAKLKNLLHSDNTCVIESLTFLPLTLR